MEKGVEGKAIYEPRSNSVLRSRDDCCFLSCHIALFDPRLEHVRLGHWNRKETIELRYRQYLGIGPQMRARKKTHPLLFSVIQWTGRAEGARYPISVTADTSRLVCRSRSQRQSWQDANAKRGERSRRSSRRQFNRRPDCLQQSHPWIHTELRMKMSLPDHHSMLPINGPGDSR